MNKKREWNNGVRIRKRSVREKSKARGGTVNWTLKEKETNKVKRETQLHEVRQGDFEQVRTRQRWRTGWQRLQVEPAVPPNTDAQQ